MTPDDEGGEVGEEGGGGEVGAWYDVKQSCKKRAQLRQRHKLVHTHLT